jgi:hypothetical protein
VLVGVGLGARQDWPTRFDVVSWLLPPVGGR